LNEKRTASAIRFSPTCQAVMDQDEKLTKVHVSFVDGGGESMWARQIEGDLFAIRNLPFFAFGLNFDDVVRAPKKDDEIREVRAVIRPSGHRTLRVVFHAHLTADEQVVQLDALNDLGGSFERATDRMVAIDVPPGAAYDAMVAFLTKLETDDDLVFETCEARNAEGFGDLAEPDVAS
jgi:hypothetical protein